MFSMRHFNGIFTVKDRARNAKIDFDTMEEAFAYISTYCKNVDVANFNIKREKEKGIYILTDRERKMRIEFDTLDDAILYIENCGGDKK